ncbi:hypothetical protein HJFPF1_09751 [Paramyrothecium foliicola]|nr:hypothetical protein HJFPF1_09751 [Paramyrothecium foliicola]
MPAAFQRDGIPLGRELGVIVAQSFELDPLPWDITLPKHASLNMLHTRLCFWLLCLDCRIGDLHDCCGDCALGFLRGFSILFGNQKRLNRVFQ